MGMVNGGLKKGIVRRRTWRKPHVLIDAKTQCVVAAENDHEKR